MRKLLLAVMTVCAVFLLNSCEEEDACKDVVCQNSGICVAGICDCDGTGYEGTTCQTAMNLKFIDNAYTVSDTCTTLGYNNNITAGTGPDKIVFSNLGNFSTPAVVTATVNGTNVSISNFQDVADRIFNGSGALVGDSVLNLSYSILYADSTTESCYAVFTKP